MKVREEDRIEIELIKTPKPETSEDEMKISVDSSTLMTVPLLVNGSGFVPTSTVTSPVDGSNIKYLKVMQNLDVYCCENDTIQSTLRTDGVHMTNLEQRLLAKVVSRAIDTMGI